MKTTLRWQIQYQIQMHKFRQTCGRLSVAAAKIKSHWRVICVIFLLLVFIQPLRNIILWPILPTAWTQFNSWEVFIVMTNQVSGRQLGMLKPCTSHRGTYKPNVDYNFVGVREEDEMAQKKALQFLQDMDQEMAILLSKFYPHMSLADKNRLLTLWTVLDKALKRRKIKYFFYAGSLLGVVRHHGMIPWDDEIDIIVWEEDDKLLQDVLSCVEEYTLRVEDNYHYKFFHDRALIVSAYGGARMLHPPTPGGWDAKEEDIQDVVVRYPYIDIFIARNYSGRTFPLTDYATADFMVPNDWILPLKEALFEGFLVPVPNQTRRVLDFSYQVSMCISPSADHRKGTPLPPPLAIPCKQLAAMYDLYDDTISTNELEK